MFTHLKVAEIKKHSPRRRQLDDCITQMVTGKKIINRNSYLSVSKPSGFADLTCETVWQSQGVVAVLKWE